MQTSEYLKVLVEEIHSAVMATIGPDGHPVTRAMDLMLFDEKGVYFLTAKGKDLYAQLMEQGFVALSAVKDKKAVSLRGRVENIGSEKLGEIFAQNTYMQKLYPESTGSALTVFRIFEAEGSFFDISDPSHVKRGSFAIGGAAAPSEGYLVDDKCTGCGACLEKCPQKCIDISARPAVIDQSRCLRCGNCAGICPAGAVKKALEQDR